jgi:hypothetical protein
VVNVECMPADRGSVEGARQLNPSAAFQLVSKGRGPIYLSLPMLSAALLASTYLIPLYPYAWEPEGEFAMRADSDSALVIVWLSLLGVIFAVMATLAAKAVLFEQPRRSRILGISIWLIIGAQMWRLIQALPAYTG